MESFRLPLTRIPPSLFVFPFPLSSIYFKTQTPKHQPQEYHRPTLPVHSQNHVPLSPLRQPPRSERPASHPPMFPLLSSPLPPSSAGGRARRVSNLHCPHAPFSPVAAWWGGGAGGQALHRRLRPSPPSVSRAHTQHIPPRLWLLVSRTHLERKRHLL